MRPLRATAACVRSGKLQVQGDRFGDEDVRARFDGVDCLAIVGRGGDGDEHCVQLLSRQHVAMVGIAVTVLLLGDTGGGFGVDVTDGRDGSLQFFQTAQVVAGDPANADKPDLHVCPSSSIGHGRDRPRARSPAGLPGSVHPMRT